MRAVMARYPGVEFSFQDPVFGLNKAWALEFCARLRLELPNVVWGAITRVDLCTPELLKAMGEAGEHLRRVRVWEAPGCSATYSE